MKYTHFVLVSIATFLTFSYGAQELSGPQKDIDAILAKVKTFSKLVVAGEHEAVAASYTEDAKIFPNGVDIIQGREAIAEYWKPMEGTSISYHKLSPLEIEIIGESAIDHGYYEGTSVGEDGAESHWRGKYVVTWRKVQGDWQIYLDIWNGIRPIENSTDEVQAIDSTQIEPKVTGIGGIFFKAKDPKAVREWYHEHLGLAITDWGSPFEFRNAHRPEEINYLSWGAFPNDTEYFDPSDKDLMINYRVQNIDALVEKLKSQGVIVLDEMQSFSYGKFIHILDLEGNKVELWEPIDSVLTESGEETTK